MWPFSTNRQAGPRSQRQWNLSDPLLWLSATDSWTLTHAFAGTIGTGATGVGKSTAIGAALASALLRAMFGGLILVAKPGERQVWERYCQLAGRLQDLVIFDASGRHRFNFLDEELQRPGRGAGLTENILSLLSTVLEIAERNGGHGSHNEEAYWKRALRQLCRNLIDLLVLAQGRVTIPDLYRLAISAPCSFEQLRSPDWQRDSFCFHCLQAADGRAKTVRQRQDYALVADYFCTEFVQLSEKTRSVILSTFSSLVDVLNRSLLRDLFSTETTLRPEDTLDGKILLIDLPVKEFMEVGQFAAVLWKYCFQRAIERRDVHENPRPVFLWADEFHHFTTSYDMEFQTTARSSRVATVYLTQNISTLLAAFGGDQARALTDSLLGNLQTKIWCANGDPVTNEWAANVIGRSPQFFINANQSSNTADWTNALFGLGGPTSMNSGISQQMEYELPPRHFTTLRCGGPESDWNVDSIVFQGGRQFSNGKTWLPVTFRQQF